jgi:hypothetical protein
MTSTVIAVILPHAPDASMLEALNRLRGEADSVGFELRLVEAEPDGEPRAQLDSVARSLSPAAVVALVGRREATAAPDGAGPAPDQPSSPTVDASPAYASIGSIDVWFLDRVTGETSVGHLTVEEEAGSRAELVLAVRVVDFIRARMFDSLVRARAEAKAERPPPVTHALAGRRFVAVGVSSTGSFAGFGIAFLPTLELGYTVREWLRLSVTAAGFGSEPRQETTAGSATLKQKLLGLRALFMARPRWRLQPFVEAGATAYFVSVHGVGYSGNVGYSPSGWSPGARATAGLVLILARHLALQLDAGAMVLAREPRVFVADVEVARTGRPAWLGSALLGASF